MTEADEKQLDWYAIEDARAAIDRELSAAVERQGEFEVARLLKEDPSIVNKQLKRTERRRPSSDLFILAFILDKRLREVAVGQCKEVLVRRQDLTAGEALRLIHAKAQASWDRRALADIADVLSRVGGTEDTWERRAVAAGWQPPGGHR